MGRRSLFLARSQHPPQPDARRDAAHTHQARIPDAYLPDRLGAVCYASLTPQNPGLISGTVAAGRAAMSADRESFGEVLRRLRSCAALSQDALAERAGLSKRGISDLERGARLAPRLETVRLLADALALGEHDRIALLTAARPALRRLDGSEPTPAGPSSVPGMQTARVDLPSGTIIALASDLAEMPRLWREHHDALPAASIRYEALVRTAAAAYGGTVLT